MSEIEFAKNGQWSLSSSAEPPQSGTPEYWAEHNTHIKNFYSHSPEARAFLNESDIGSIPAHLRRKANHPGANDWTITPMLGHSRTEDTYTPKLKPGAENKTALSTADMAPSDKGWTPTMFHAYQVHHKGQPVGPIQITSDGGVLFGGPAGAIENEESHKFGNYLESFLNSKRPGQALSPVQKKLRYGILGHVRDEALLHHVHTRIAKPKGLT